MFCIEKLDKSRHDRNSFISSNHLFDDYLKKFANQDIKRNKTIVYVAVQQEDFIPKRIYGYYSINSFALTDRDYSEPRSTSYLYNFTTNASKVSSIRSYIIFI